MNPYYPYVTNKCDFCEQKIIKYTYISAGGDTAPDELMIDGIKYVKFEWKCNFETQENTVSYLKKPVV